MSEYPVGIGVVGCGAISGAYFEHGVKCEALRFVACADLDAERARAAAETREGLRACSVEDILADPAVEIVLNLTVPKAHAEVAMRAVEAGKHVYNEKPLTVSREEAAQLLRAAEAKGVRVGAAPDTVLGGGVQTCRKLIDDGWIGRPVAADAFMMCRGHESWHPSPEFYYEVGGGPMFDMGPYYLHALVTLLGPMRGVTAAASSAFPHRTITSAPKFGKIVEVETPTHVTGVIEFAGGALCTMTTSFDVHRHRLPCIEVHGTEGSMIVPDPNGFGGPVHLFRPEFGEWREMPLCFDATVGRGKGVADLACATRSGRAHRASGALAAHALDAMHAFLDSAGSGRRVELTTTCDRPEALPLGLRPGELDR